MIIHVYDHGKKSEKPTPGQWIVAGLEIFHVQGHSTNFGAGRQWTEIHGTKVVPGVEDEDEIDFMRRQTRQHILKTWDFICDTLEEAQRVLEYILPLWEEYEAKIEAAQRMLNFKASLIADRSDIDF